MSETQKDSSEKKEVYIDYKQRRQIAPLTSARAFAILWVVMYHYHTFMTPIADDNLLHEILKYGIICLDFFFVLSGFILTHIYRNSFNTNQLVRKNILKFYLYRLSRIYPLHLTVLFTILIMQMTGLIINISEDVARELPMLPKNQGDSLLNFFMQLFMIHGWGYGNPANWSVTSWSVSSEWLFYIFFPILSFIAYKIKSTLINIILISAIIIWLNYHVNDRVLDVFRGVDHYGWVNDIKRAVANCVMGMLVANLYHNSFLKKLDWDFILPILLVIITILVINGAKEGIFFAFIPFILLGLCYIKKYMYKILSYNLFVNLGEASYSIYLWHVPLVFMVGKLSMDMGLVEELNELSWLWAFTPIMISLIFLSLISLEYIEKPFRRITKKYIK